ncbi:hypothetical protein [Desertibacillus haloalkaliphilus]|uniref:hypothetical protein n=1 Tax=Desertibacillus haloalkaliphilus TaxID=1328930 RepID=UPI001C265B8F|nr:hypothetical protein [Desertibacillus haloalkaliphilus]MBU8907523.1 hypothetical protein [Desertibacillus haloalkaliphilus]
MNKKLYYAIIIPLIIIGFIFLEIRTYVLLFLILIGGYSGWKDYRRKLKKAEGEEEIRQAIVPLILLIIFIVLFIVSFFL